MDAPHPTRVVQWIATIAAGLMATLSAAAGPVGQNESLVVGWGDNEYGQTDVPQGTFTAVAAGQRFSLAIRSDGTLVGWGDNEYGQINVPEGTFTAVAAGDRYGLAIRSDGTLAGWGWNGYGQTDAPSGTFTAVAAGIAGNGSVLHGLAIRSDGTLAGWGNNEYGQIDVPSGTFTAVAAGHAFSLAIRSDGTLAGWGYNGFGQINVPSGTFTAVAAGFRHSLALRTDGTLIGWGSQTDVPLGTFTAVVAGYHYGLAIRSDGTLAGWGYNGDGQINVPSGTFTAVAAGSIHSLAAKRFETNIALAATPNPSVSGRPVELEATVVCTEQCAGTPTGNVVFQDGGMVLGVAPLNAGGIATLAISNLAAGNHSITATYEGQSIFDPSTSPAMDQTVLPDSDGDGTQDDDDGCPNDADKVAPGVCGCGKPDTDSDSDGVLDCDDQCPDDPDKTAPGVCGCGNADKDANGNRVADCVDPTIGPCPDNITVDAIDAGGVALDFMLPEAKSPLGDVTVTSDPPRGSILPVGITTVTITTTDANGVTDSCTFTVTVNAPRPTPTVDTPPADIAATPPTGADSLAGSDGLTPATTSADMCGTTCGAGILPFMSMALLQWVGLRRLVWSRRRRPPGAN